MSDELLAALHAEQLEQGKTLSALAADMKTLVGNGKQGRIDKIEDDVEQIQAHQNYAMGATGAFSFLIAGWEVFKHFWKIT
jgi:hypothetical protein